MLIERLSGLNRYVSKAIANAHLSILNVRVEIRRTEYCPGVDLLTILKTCTADRTLKRLHNFVIILICFRVEDLLT